MPRNSEDSTRSNASFRWNICSEGLIQLTGSQHIVSVEYLFGRSWSPHRVPNASFRWNICSEAQSPHRVPNASFRLNICLEGLSHLTGYPTDRFGGISVRKALVTSQGIQQIVSVEYLFGRSCSPHRVPNASFRWNICSEALVTSQVTQCITSVEYLFGRP